MKIKYILAIVALTFVFASCEIDNYDEPDAFFTGNVVYNGEPIQVGAKEVRFQLWQSGYGLYGPLDVHLDTDGSFSGLFFSGEYKLKFIDGQGPWKAPADTLFVTINGNTQMDLEVTPYYTVSNPSFSQSGNAITGSANITKVLTGTDGRNIEYAKIYINDTQFVSNNGDYNVAQADASTITESNITASVNLPDGYNKDAVFARIGIKMNGVEDLLFSDTIKLEL